MQYRQLAEVICRNMADITGPSSHSMIEGGEEERQDILKDRKKVVNYLQFKYTLDPLIKLLTFTVC